MNRIFFPRGEHQAFTFVKELPSLTRGTVGNSRFSLIVRDPALRLYKLDITSKRSEVVFTGRKRLRGTFIPREFSKLLIAAPTAVSNWITFKPPSRVWKGKLTWTQGAGPSTQNWSPRSATAPPSAPLWLCEAAVPVNPPRHWKFVWVSVL